MQNAYGLVALKSRTTLLKKGHPQVSWFFPGCVMLPGSYRRPSCIFVLECLAFFDSFVSLNKNTGSCFEHVRADDSRVALADADVFARA